MRKLIIGAWITTVVILATVGLVNAVFAQEAAIGQSEIRVPIIISSGATGLSGIQVLATVDSGDVVVGCAETGSGQLFSCSERNSAVMQVADIDGTWDGAGDSASMGSLVFSGPAGSYEVNLTFPQVDDDNGSPVIFEPITFTLTIGQ